MREQLGNKIEDYSDPFILKKGKNGGRIESDGVRRLRGVQELKLIEKYRKAIRAKGILSRMSDQDSIEGRSGFFPIGLSEYSGHGGYGKI